MGTSYSIILVNAPSQLSLHDLKVDIEDELEWIEVLASTYRADSELSGLNNADAQDWLLVNDQFCGMLTRAKHISAESNGAFDLTIGPLVNLWGFGARERLANIPTQREIDLALQRIGFEKLQLDCEQSRVRKTVSGMQIDLSGWAKGYAADRVAGLLAQASVDNFLVEIGGELRVSGYNRQHSPFLIGIENPVAGDTGVFTGLRMTNAGIATSGGYRNHFNQGGKRYSHTIDPRTGWPVEHDLASVTVISNSAAKADAMATALLVLGLDAGLAMANENDIAALFIRMTPSGPQIRRSDALPADAIESF